VSTASGCRIAPEAMTADAQQCLIIVPRREPELYARLREHFAGDTRVFIRLDSRTGERAIDRMEIFAVGGGGALTAELRAHVEAQLGLLRKPPEAPRPG
jgi:hypothetical protein